jgi:hypothetical protein
MGCIGKALVGKGGSAYRKDKKKPKKGKETK